VLRLNEVAHRFCLGDGRAFHSEARSVNSPGSASRAPRSMRAAQQQLQPLQAIVRCYLNEISAV